MATPNRIFVDSNYFVALQNTEDSLHKKAIKATVRLAEENAKVVISNLVFLEVVTILSQRAGRKIANAFGSDLLSSPNIEVLHIGKSLQSDTWEIFKSISKKNISFIDCSILAAMRQQEIDSLLTFDRTDFSGLRDQYGFSFF